MCKNSHVILRHHYIFESNQSEKVQYTVSSKIIAIKGLIRFRELNDRKRFILRPGRKRFIFRPVNKTKQNKMTTILPDGRRFHLPDGWLVDNDAGELKDADHVVVLGGTLDGESGMVVASALGDSALISLFFREPSVLRKVLKTNLVVLVEGPLSGSDGYTLDIN